MLRRGLRYARGLLAAALVAGVSVGFGGERSTAPHVESFRSKPELSPPAVELTKPTDPDAAPGYVFVAPKQGEGQNGPMIIDDEGEIVWWHEVAGDDIAADFRVQRYQGEQVLTWWEGDFFQGFGEGEFVIYDDRYREVARFAAGNGLEGDLHEFLITARGTALINIYDEQPADLSSVGGPTDGAILDGLVQEVDIETGRVLFEWRASDHVELDESLQPLPAEPGAPYDFFHINSADVDRDGNLLVSARHTNATYKLDRESGEVIWRLGGTDSDFEMGPGTTVTGQHDARRQPDGTITIFDNGAPPPTLDHSRAIVLDLDIETMTATLAREQRHPSKPLADSQGNAQRLPGGGLLVGWGSEGIVSEFNADGELLFDARFADEDNDTYRAYRMPWSGRPQTRPAVAAQPRGPDETTVYASWNGATEVEGWSVLAGSSPEALRPIGSVEREGFETAIRASTAESYVAVRALDARERPLGTSAPVELSR